MKHLLVATCVGLFILPAGAAEADLYAELKELKRICDDGLLPADECKKRRHTLVDRAEADREAWFCNYHGETEAPTQFQGDHKGYGESASASSIVKEILDEAGLAPNFIVRPANVPNAAASARGGQRFVEYNPAFITQLKAGTKSNWSVYSVLAHEIGHHLQGHTIQAGGSRPAIELEADEYSGFILAKLGASMEMAQRAMKTLGSDSSLGTHPPTNRRLTAIAKGWKRGKKGRERPSPQPKPVEPIVHPAPPQPTVAYTDTCIIKGEAVLVSATGAVVSRARGYMQVGERRPSRDARCRFMLRNQVGEYCVAQNGTVYYGSPDPVGKCSPCHGNMCQ